MTKDLYSGRDRTKRLRVCHVCSGHGSDDGRVFQRFCVTLAEAGYDVHLIARSEEPSIYTTCGVTIHPIPECDRYRRLLRRGAVARLAASINPGLFHVHEPELLGPVLRLAGKIPVVYDVHESYLDILMDRDWIPKPLRPIARFLWDVQERKHVKKCAAVASATDRVASRYTGLHRNVQVVANYPDVKEMIHLPSPETPELDACVFTGTILSNRGLAEVIVAAGILRNRGLSIKIYIAGNASSAYIHELFALADRQGVSDLVNYRGVLSRKEAIALASQCSIGLVPHLPYGNNLAAWPVKMMEYMALGLPLVYSNLPSHMSIAAGREIGLSVDATQPMQIANAIERLMLDPHLRRRASEAGKKAVTEMYNWGLESKKLLGLYEKVLRR